MGRKPKPTRLKILAGNPGKRPLNASEPMPARGIPPCPAWLDPIGQEVWAEVVPELDRVGLLTIVDGWAMAAFCAACSELRVATETLAREGYEVERGTGGLGNHPAVSRRHGAMERIAKFGAMLGLDPSSRSSMHVAPPSKEEDEFESFLGG